MTLLMDACQKHLLWMLLAQLCSALWVLNVEITYERNVRHPTNFRSQPCESINWKA